MFLGSQHTSNSHLIPPDSQRTAAQLWSFLPENRSLNRTFHAGTKNTHHAPSAKKWKEDSLRPSLTNQGSRASHSRTASGEFTSTTSFAFSSLGIGTVFWAKASPMTLPLMPFLSKNAHKKIGRTILQDLIIHRLTLFTAMGFSSCGRWPAEMISKSMDLRSWSAECHDCMSWHLVPSKQRTTKLGKRSVQMGPIVTYDMQIQGKGV